MKQKKLSLANIQGRLSRAEMKKIMAGSVVGCFVDTANTCDPTHMCYMSSGPLAWCKPDPPPSSFCGCYW